MSETTIRISWKLHALLSDLKREKQKTAKRSVSFEEIIWDLSEQQKEVEVTA